MNDKTPLRELKGVGDKTEKLFQKIGITTTEELLRYYPRTYDIYEEPVEQPGTESADFDYNSGRPERPSSSSLV